MALQIPSYPNPFSTTPLSNAYAWMTFLAIDFSAGAGRIQVGINTDAASANAGLPQIDSFSVPLGSTLVAANPDASPPVAEVDFPSLETLMSNADFAAAFGVIRGILYDNLLNHPKLAGATEVA